MRKSTISPKTRELINRAERIVDPEVASQFLTESKRELSPYEKKRIDREIRRIMDEERGNIDLDNDDVYRDIAKEARKNYALGRKLERNRSYEVALSTYSLSAKGYRNLGNTPMELRALNDGLRMITDHIGINNERNMVDYIESRKREINRTEGNLVNILSRAAAVIGIGGGALFLSHNISGNAIANMPSSTSNIYGIILLLMGLVGAFFWMKSKKH